MRTFKKTHRNRGPTASGVLNAESTRKLLYSGVLNVSKGAQKVGFIGDLLFDYNFGPNVDINFLKIAAVKKLLT